MKRKSILKVVNIFAMLSLLVQLVALHPLGAPQGSGRAAHAAALPQPQCVDTNIPPGRSFTAPGRQILTLTHDEAELRLGADVLTATTVITITPLHSADLPPLDQGMTNVTKGPRCGYRFEPHPARFGGMIRVSIPYNRALIPPGLTEQDIKTFYFDDQANRWKELERVEVDSQAQMIVSLTDHFTDIINATVTIPDHPEPLSNNPTSIKGIKAADPSANISL